jgi:hypothetical protein
MLLCGNGSYYGPRGEVVNWKGKVSKHSKQNNSIIGVHVDMDEKILKFDFHKNKDIHVATIPYPEVKMTIEWFYEGQRATVLQVDSVVYERWSY